MSKVGPKPSRDHIEQVVKKLVMKYPFMADDHGNGYVSCITIDNPICISVCMVNGQYVLY